MTEDLFTGLEEPNHTQTPNTFFDELLKQIETVTELKVTLAIIRQTFGWHKAEDELSLSQLEALTGLSRQGVCDGLKFGLERGSIVRRKSGQSYKYCLKLVSAVDQSATLTSQQRGLEVVSNVDRQLVSNADTQKKAPKEKKESGSGGRKQPPSADALISEMAKSPAYSGIDVKREFYKMQAWCDVNNKQSSRRRFVNWLNRVDVLPARASPVVESAAEKSRRLEEEMRRAKPRPTA
jgi:phage replication O-like protein O